MGKRQWANVPNPIKVCGIEIERTEIALSTSSAITILIKKINRVLKSEQLDTNL